MKQDDHQHMNETSSSSSSPNDNPIWRNRINVLLKHISPNLHTVATSTANVMHNNSHKKTKKQQDAKQLNEQQLKKNKWLIGYPNTTAHATLFSRVMEKVYSKTVPVTPTSPLVEQPKGDPPDIAQVFQHNIGSGSGGSGGGGGGHVCIVGPTGSGKSTIVRGILCELSKNSTMSIYSLEYPVEVNLNTHGLFHVCQIDMFQEIQGKQRSLAETANALLRHDPDMIYFGELRNKIDFETATSIALSGVSVISTGHASSPIDLLERLRSMNIDLKTQFRAFKCILGVKRVPLLCPHCKRQMVMYGKSDNRALQLLNIYRIVSFNKSHRRQVLPVVCMPPDPNDSSSSSADGNNKSKDSGKTCPHCINGYLGNHTIYEYLYITPNSDMEKLRQNHTYTTEETLIALIQEGSVNPLYLQNSL